MLSAPKPKAAKRVKREDSRAAPSKYRNLVILFGVGEVSVKSKKTGAVARLLGFGAHKLKG